MKREMKIKCPCCGHKIITDLNMSIRTKGMSYEKRYGSKKADQIIAKQIKGREIAEQKEVERGI